MYEHKVDLLILELLQIGTESIHNMRVVNIYTHSHQNKSPNKGLLTAEMEKYVSTWRNASVSVTNSPHSWSL